MKRTVEEHIKALQFRLQHLTDELMGIEAGNHRKL